MIQRVSRARVVIDSVEHASIQLGILILLGVEKGDTAQDGAALAKKIIELRIFEDETVKMNRSVVDTQGEVLVVSQFTLVGDCRKGRRPSFDDAAPPDQARQLYESFVESVRSTGVRVQTGVFQANMDVELVNQGPVTFILESKRSC